MVGYQISDLRGCIPSKKLVAEDGLLREPDV